MKIILKQEVSGLGAPGDVVEVKDGFGRNYLLPQGFAMPWSKGAEKQVSLIKRARSAREIRDLGHANEVKAQLEELKINYRARAGEGGRLFGSVTAAEVVAAVKAAGGPELDRRRVELPGHIKSVGAYQVQVKLHPEVTAKISFSVTPAKAVK
jgi:large subunit ribosomal protein L9